MPPAPTIRGQIGEKGEPQAPLDAMKRANPDRKAVDALSYADYTENCQRCVVAYELNRRGYNVEAEATYEKDLYPVAWRWTRAFKGARVERIGASTSKEISQNLLNKMKQWGEGSRAVVHVDRGKSGHVFNVEYRGGKLYYYDPQTDIRYRPEKVFDRVRKQTVSVVRVDHLKITDSVRDLVRKSRTPR